MKRQVAIVGGGQTKFAARRHDVNQIEMVNEAVRAALEDAELTMDQVDAVVQGNMEFFEGTYMTDCWMASGVGNYGKPGVKITTGGTVGATVVHAGAHFVASGLYDTVLVIGFEKQEEGDTNAILSGVAHPLYGRSTAGAALGFFAQQGSTYMSKYGATEEHSAMVSVKSRQNGRKNEYSHLQLDIGIQDALNSRMLAWPIRLLDMCPASNGACAVIVQSEDKARKGPKKPVWIQAMDTSHNEQFELNWRDMYSDKPRFSEVSAERIYKKLGVKKPAEYFDVFEVYEPATWAELVWYEDLHLCERGDGWKLIEKGMTEIDGEIPVNPSGGVLCTNAIGATALCRIWECVLQIRGEAGDHQVPAEVHRALATAYGGTCWTALTALSDGTKD